MKDHQGVVFIRREGTTAKGAQWHDFMQAQRDALDAYRLHGWKLVAAVGVHDERALQGVLLYFSKDG
jgi:hypothetical protein